MTPRSEIKREVGIRELHDQLSRYVRHVADGGDVLVTMRGRPVARMAPIEDDPLADLCRRGIVREPTSSWSPDDRRRLHASQPVSDLVAEQRR